jgi:hypothetical protein
VGGGGGGVGAREWRGGDSRLVFAQYRAGSGTAYQYMYSLYPGLYVLFVAKWDGIQGTADFQDVMSRGLDTYSSGYTVQNVRGWGRAGAGQVVEGGEGMRGPSSRCRAGRSRSARRASRAARPWATTRT